VSYSHMANATLPSALQRFTSVFGMGTGGSIALLPPGIFGSLTANLLPVSNKSWKAVTSRSLIRSSIKQALQNYLGVVWLSLSGH
jgi:hypothetical protein